VDDDPRAPFFRQFTNANTWHGAYHENAASKVLVMSNNQRHRAQTILGQPSLSCTVFLADKLRCSAALLRESDQP
jgi:hypothetical protein